MDLKASYEKDGYVLKIHASENETEVDCSKLEKGYQVRLHFLIHIGGGYTEKDANVEEEDMTVEYSHKMEGGILCGTLCGCSMNSDRLEHGQKICFTPKHVISIKTLEMIQKEQQMFSGFVIKQKVVEDEREEYYRELERKKEEEERLQKEEQEKFIQEGGFFFGSGGGEGDNNNNSNTEEQTSVPDFLNNNNNNNQNHEGDGDGDGGFGFQF